MEEKIKIKIWEKIPPGILIPLVVFGSVAFAVFLIWLGIKLAPVELTDPETLSAEKQQEEWRKKRLNKGNGNENSTEDISLPEYQYNPNENKADAQEGSVADNDNFNSGGTGSGSEGDQSGVANQADTSSSGNDQNEDTSENSDSSSKSGDATQNGSTAAAGCTYPSGDINVWWHKASLKQRDCYISKHGVPVFSSEEPYFCDYENSKDCYYMKYK